MRFEHFGRVLRRKGGELAYLTLSQALPEWRSDFQSLSFDEACAETWDATMVPGAGFPDAMLERLSDFEEPRFGTRVQHLLNDQSRRDSFLRVNRNFKPEVVVVNNRHWDDQSLSEFDKRRHAYLEGAVDLERFVPRSDRRPLDAKDEIVIGALANKNIDPVVQALALLPNKVKLRAIGKYDNGKFASQIASGRLTLSGVVNADGLVDFFRDVDLVTHTELSAGWANIAAEAMACGIPVICTSHGTLPLAEHEITALVIADATPELIAQNVRRLIEEPHLVSEMVERARQNLTKFGWTEYAQGLLDICGLACAKD